VCPEGPRVGEFGRPFGLRLVAQLVDVNAFIKSPQVACHGTLQTLVKSTIISSSLEA